MRNTLLFTLLVLLGCYQHLHGQSWPDRGFQISLTLEPTWDRKIVFTPWVTARDTLPLPPINEFGISSRRDTDTLLIEGVPVVYYSDPARRRDFSRVDALFELLSSIRLHYRFRKFEAGLGFVYSTTTNSPRIVDTEDLPGDFFYRSLGTRSRYAAVVSQFSYHPLPQSRIGPYAGLQLRLGVSHQSAINFNQVFPGINLELDALDQISPRFRDNTILDFDLILLAGINFRVNNRWMIGIEGELSRFLLPSPRGLQIRYALGPKKELQ